MYGDLAITQRAAMLERVENVLPRVPRALQSYRPSSAPSSSRLLSGGQWGGEQGSDALQRFTARRTGSSDMEASSPLASSPGQPDAHCTA